MCLLVILADELVLTLLRLSLFSLVFKIIKWTANRFDVVKNLSRFFEFDSA